MTMLHVVMASLCVVLTPAQTEEVALFDAEGAPRAYIAVQDELTIYLWDGTPVAYLEMDHPGFSIYGFNGQHLGWFDEGIVRDRQGNAVGFSEGAIAVATRYEPYKAYKKFKPLRRLQRLPPLRPLFVDRWSRTPLSLFLAAGRS